MLTPFSTASLLKAAGDASRSLRWMFRKTPPSRILFLMVGVVVIDYGCGVSTTRTQLQEG
jgi:hypothetical protein